ncbi:MAG: hypothetical protein HY303_04330 [Candidatus Wallbacteria bacterium]|nr:hypothetical protein [Candidatus Wallbacteria bacterium]
MRDSKTAEPVYVDPVIEAYKPGLDVTLLRESLKRTPHQRVMAMLSMLELVEEARQAGKRAGLRP